MLLRGGGGWTYYNEVEPSGELFVRLDDEGRVVELYMNRGGTEITGADLRGLRLDRIRALAQARPDLAAFALDWPTPDVRGEALRAFPEGWHKSLPEPTPSDVVLTPDAPADGITPGFLRFVAAAYTAAVARGERPNKALAAQSGYPQRTVERWVYMARKGGYLPPTLPGSIG